MHMLNSSGTQEGMTFSFLIFFNFYVVLFSNGRCRFILADRLRV